LELSRQGLGDLDLDRQNRTHRPHRFGRR
jgi:hypothetical protein